MVTGGKDKRYDTLDSSEIYDNDWRIVSAILPVKLYWLRGATINNRMMVIGN